LEIPEDGFLVLAVSSHDSRKRFGEIEGAICALAEEFPIYGIFTGIRPHTHTLNRNIRFMGHVADAELRQLYSTCDAYVNWSAAEGFGLPVVEALACGARVIVPHDTAALREVGGRHILSPTQTSRAGLIALLRELCQKRPPRAKIADLSAFNWDRSARSIDERLWRPTAQTKEIRLRIGA
ncbi:MAG: glycosyltransferase, partial [Planctomycetota bacterium]